AGTERVRAVSDSCGILVALDATSLAEKASEAAGAVLFDPDLGTLDAGSLRRHAAGVPLSSAGMKVEPCRWGMAAMGAVARLAGLDPGILDAVLRDLRGSRDSGALAGDLMAAKAGFAAAGAAAPDAGARLPRSDRPLKVLSGPSALALGAMAAGCKFAAAGPGASRSWPWASLAARAERHGVVLFQGSSDGSAAGAAVGAGLAGVRGLALVSSAADAASASGFAERAEIPIVVAVLGGSFPSWDPPAGPCRGVLVPSGPADALDAALEAFNLAERFQAPVFLMLDNGVTGCSETVERMRLDVPVDRGVWAVAQDAGGPSGRAWAFDRHAGAVDGVSPRAVPGHEGLMFTARAAAPSDKLAAKRGALGRGAAVPLLEGPSDAELTLVGAGPVCGTMRVVMMRFNSGGGRAVNLLPLRRLEPFPSDGALGPLKSARRILVAEPHPAGPLARLIREETGIAVERRISWPEGGTLEERALSRAVEEALHG
ncbi:MAG: hypothetical protein WC943_13500, partial [Elusimicrobiota bacterium]